MAQGKKGRDPKQPDVYDRMLLERKGVHVAHHSEIPDMVQHWQRDKKVQHKFDVPASPYVMLCVKTAPKTMSVGGCLSLAFCLAQSGVSEEDIGMRMAEGTALGNPQAQY